MSFAEGLTPIAVDIDEFGHARAMRFSARSGEVVLPARAVLVAAGTQPNTVLAREEGVGFELEGKYYRACDESGTAVTPERAISKPKRADVLLHRNDDGRFVSYFGDLHPSFFGNVVKAMASAKQGYPVVSRVLGQTSAAWPLDDNAFFARLNQALRAVVHEVRRLTPKIVEVVIRAPQAARRFKPGQFYRLQNYE